MSFTDAQRRFVLVDTPVSPGYCRGCLGDKQTTGLEYLIDLGFSDEQGVIYLCNRCIKEMANLFGFYQRTQKVDNLVIDLERQVAEYEWKHVLLRDAGLDVDTLVSYLNVGVEAGESVSAGAERLERERNATDKPDNGKGPNDTGSIGRLKFSDGD